MEKSEVARNLRLYIDKITSFVENVRQGDISRVNEIIEIAEELKQWFVVVTGEGCFGIDREIYLAKITSTLQELILSLENTDYVLMADALEYEGLEMVQEWLEVVEKSC